MEGTMRQMILTGPRKSTIIEVPIPTYTDDEMLVRVTLTGMCHSEWYPWATARPGDVLGHERRINYEADLCRRCMELLSKGIWKFTGVTKIFDMKDFNMVSEMMEHHTDNFIKGAFRP